MPTMISYIDALVTARALVDDGANVEYTRGICELIADLFGGMPGTDHADRAAEVAGDIGIHIDH